MQYQAVRSSTFSALGIAVLAAALVLVPAAQRGLAGVSLPAPAGAPTVAQGNGLLAAQSVAFIENRGQWDAQAKFLARAPGANVWITDSGAVFDFFKITDSENPRTQARRKGHVVRMEFVGASPTAVDGVKVLDGRLNYFIGRDQSKWATNVPRYQEARTDRLYDGVDVRYYYDQGRPRYDLIVAPGSDPNKIAMRFEGAGSISAKGATLRIGTSLGAVEQRGLFAYQNSGGATKQVPCSFDVRGNTVRFAVGAYDRSRPLVIDPLLWSSYLGGNGEDVANAICLDSTGRPVIVGSAGSSNFPFSAGAYDTVVNGTYDIFMAKLSANGGTLITGTYMGGEDTDRGLGVALDSSGDPVIVGTTNSAALPTSAGAFDSTYGGLQDGYVAKLSADGTTLIFCTYLGSADEDNIETVVIDSSNQPVVGGNTKDAGYPTTAGAYDTTHSTSYDAVVTKLAADGTSLVWSTFVGGTADDSVKALALGASDRVYFTGYTQSFDYPLTTGTTSGSYDVCVTRLSADGAALVSSACIGGSSSDHGYALTFDGAGDLWVTGRTFSSNFPTTAGAFDTVADTGINSYVFKIDPIFFNTIYCSTYLGGAQDDEGKSIKCDAAGNPIVVGYTGSTDFPTTPEGFDTTANGGQDGFVTKLSPTLDSLLYSTYLGGSSFDKAVSLAVNSAGDSYVCGSASDTFPTTAGALDTTFGGTNTDGFVSKVGTAPALFAASFPGSKVVGGFSVPLTIDLTQTAVANMIVSLSTDTPGKIFPNVSTKVKAGQKQKTVGIATESVKTDTVATVFATFNGVTVSDTITIQPGGLLTLKLAGSTIPKNTASTGTVTLSGPAQKDRNVALSSSSAKLTVDATATVATGTTTKSFSITAGNVAANTNVTVTGTLGVMTKTDTITITP